MFTVSMLSVYEYFNMLKKYKPNPFVSLVMAAGFFLILCFCESFGCMDKVLIAVFLMLLTLFSIELFNGNTELSIERIATSFLGIFFIPLAFVHMVYIRGLNCGMQLVFFIFIEVWVLDTAAYAFGYIFGKHKLAKEISPKKTVEGAVAGTIFGIFAALACRYLFMRNILSIYESLILGLFISISGQFSDLAESLIKRDGNVKDSGRLIPGHGGVFDRFDSYLFTAPVVYYVLTFIK
jgi:phosphatidate cytidylyltransferase